MANRRRRLECGQAARVDVLSRRRAGFCRTERRRCGVPGFHSLLRLPKGFQAVADSLLLHFFLGDCPVR